MRTGSELAVEQRWYPFVALDDLLGIEEGKINDTRLYRMLPHKTLSTEKWTRPPAVGFCILSAS